MCDICQICEKLVKLTGKENTHQANLVTSPIPGHLSLPQTLLFCLVENTEDHCGLSSSTGCIVVAFFKPLILFHVSLRSLCMEGRLLSGFGTIIMVFMLQRYNSMLLSKVKMQRFELPGTTLMGDTI